jgi:hypothetical protein
MGLEIYSYSQLDMKRLQKRESYDRDLQDNNYSILIIFYIQRKGEIQNELQIILLEAIS